MPFGFASTRRKFSQLQICWLQHGPEQTKLPAQGKPPLLPSPLAVWMTDACPRSTLVTIEQEKWRRMDAASILQEALKGYQVAAQILASFIAERNSFCEGRAQFQATKAPTQSTWRTMP